MTEKGEGMSTTAKDLLVMSSKTPPVFNDHRLPPVERMIESKLYVMFKDWPKDKIAGFLSMSVDEMIELAANAETIRKSMQPFDYAWQRFVNEETNLLKLAEFQEARLRYIHKLQETPAQI